MLIKQIHMTDYKRFHDLTINLGDSPKRIVALVGPNGCGKSSVFDAMLYRMISNTGIFGDSAKRKDFHYHSLLQDRGYKSESISIELDKGSFNTVFFEMEESGIGSSILSFRSSFRYNSELMIKETKALSSILTNNFGASTASDLDQRIDQNYRRLLAFYSDYMEKYNARPSEARQYIIGELNDAIHRCLDIEIVSLGNITNGEGTLFFKKSDSEMVFQFNVLSAGEKEVVDLLIDLFLRKESFKDSIYIIDEPELHLHTAVQRKLLLEINKMVPENCQIWIATHSIGFLRALQDELKDIVQIVEFPAENKWASETYVLTPSIPNHYMWKRLFTTALDDLSTLICPKTIIYCEGRDEPGQNGKERGLDAQVYNTIFARKYPDVLFISSGGNTELDSRSDIAIRILSKVFEDLQVFVLKDRDCASGREVTDEQRQEYLANNPQSHRLLKRFEVENYLFDKEVLEAYCKSQLRDFDNAYYSTIVHDIVNQEVKSKVGEIKKCCGIITSINAEMFKLQLAKGIDETMGVYEELEQVIFQRK